MKNIKKYAKYILNVLVIINALLTGIAPIWNIPADKIIETITVVCAVISTYLLGNKISNNIKEGNNNEEIK